MTEKTSLPHMHSVESTNVEAVGHDGDALFVRFKGGGTYRYDGAGKEHLDELLKASSPGGYIAAQIRKRYRGVKVDV